MPAAVWGPAPVVAPLAVDIGYLCVTGQVCALISDLLLLLPRLVDKVHHLLGNLVVLMVVVY